MTKIYGWRAFAFVYNETHSNSTPHEIYIPDLTMVVVRQKQRKTFSFALHGILFHVALKCFPIFTWKIVVLMFPSILRFFTFTTTKARSLCRKKMFWHFFHTRPECVSSSETLDFVTAGSFSFDFTFFFQLKEFLLSRRRFYIGERWHFSVSRDLKWDDLGQGEQFSFLGDKFEMIFVIFSHIYLMSEL